MIGGRTKPIALMAAAVRWPRSSLSAPCHTFPLKVSPGTKRTRPSVAFACRRRVRVVSRAGTIDVAMYDSATTRAVAKLTPARSAVPPAPANATEGPTLVRLPPYFSDARGTSVHAEENLPNGPLVADWHVDAVHGNDGDGHHDRGAREKPQEPAAHPLGHTETILHGAGQPPVQASA